MERLGWEFGADSGIYCIRARKTLAKGEDHLYIPRHEGEGVMYDERNWLQPPKRLYKIITGLSNNVILGCQIGPTNVVNTTS